MCVCMYVYTCMCVCVYLCTILWLIQFFSVTTILIMLHPRAEQFMLVKEGQRKPGFPLSERKITKTGEGRHNDLCYMRGKIYYSSYSV